MTRGGLFRWWLFIIDDLITTLLSRCQHIARRSPRWSWPFCPLFSKDRARAPPLRLRLINSDHHKARLRLLNGPSFLSVDLAIHNNVLHEVKATHNQWRVQDFLQRRCGHCYLILPYLPFLSPFPAARRLLLQKRLRILWLQSDLAFKREPGVSSSWIFVYILDRHSWILVRLQGNRPNDDFKVLILWAKSFRFSASTQSKHGIMCVKYVQANPPLQLSTTKLLWVRENITIHEH